VFLGSLLTRVQELEQESASRKSDADEGRRAVAESRKLMAHLEAAEDARHAAERVAEKERFARISPEEARDELIAAVPGASKQQTRIARLFAGHDVCVSLTQSCQR
jgi:hypothetical protein